MAKKYTKDAETLGSFARENKKYIAQIDRAYYGVITDAIEGGYAFNLDPDKFNLNTGIPANAGYADVLKQALAMEEKITAFYTEAAKQSGGLMADVPRTFLLVVKKRAERIAKLKQLA
jgi:hypothetical protein